MFRLLILLLLFSITLFAKDVEIFASTLDANETFVKAKGSVIVIRGEDYISADRALYNKKTKDIELFGNILVLNGTSYQALGNYAKLNSEKKSNTLSPFYFLEKKEKLWISADEGSKCVNDIDIESGVLSGCNPLKPLWKIEFSSSDYDLESKWINLYNARLYIDNIPIFYTPYFGYSLDTTRRSGLLMPGFGISSDEGIFYQQPIYIAPYDSWDLEIRPQLRTSRGQGIYGDFRFADTAYSRGVISAGYFREFDKYYNEHSIKNSKHYGGGIKYENTNFLKSYFNVDSSMQSGIYIDASWMNDVEYLNLGKNDITQNSTSSQINSRASIFLNAEEHYVGLYAKYFLDLQALNNDKTQQNLPILQYHKYIKSFLDDHLLFNFDATTTNYTKVKGKKATDATFNIPIGLQTGLFDNYLDLSYTAITSASVIKFNGGDFKNQEGTPSYDYAEYEDGSDIRLDHIVSAGTSLSKSYTDFIHTINLDASFTKKGSYSNSGYYQNIETNCTLNQNSDVCQFYNLSNRQNSLDLKFSHYFFDKNGKQFIYHKIAQQIIYDNEFKSSVQDIENELDLIVYKYITYYNDTYFNFTRAVLTKSINNLRYKDKTYNVGLSYIYENKLSFTNAQTQSEIFTRYITADASYRYDKHYKYYSRIAFDIETSTRKSMEVGFLYSKRCWDFGMKYAENNRPTVNASSESDSIFDRYIYFTVALKPIVQATSASEFGYKLSDPIETSY